MDLLNLPQIKSSAFGDGSHPTTRICARAVDFICQQKPGLSVLDVGTGSGVLARIARYRGAQFIAATDIDRDALSAARANAALDHHDLVEIQISDQLPDHWGARFDLVVANILEGPLRELAPYIAQAALPGGVLVISGFTPLQIPMLRVVFESHGFNYVSDSSLEGWALLMFQREECHAGR
jgi:ribosomal protein L11 methyltransferase